MSEKRFVLCKKGDVEYIEDNCCVQLYGFDVLCELLNEQQATIEQLQSIINHIKCEENCFDYDYCCETVCSLYNEIKHLKEENEELRKENKDLNDMEWEKFKKKYHLE